ncbi:Ig-like domain-containing protein [Gottfriedia luciferensis]|uniref:Ig-like domain-containing protein n=1 Tax=Gottfriedia luciferensis TaxID=178774 RepID=UPI001302A2CC|nr:Ig-like domain-containing protein [Gottfriedia luciferensis]
MKSTLLKVGLLTTLSIGLVAGKASAATTDWSSKCSSMGEIKSNDNPSNQQINCLLINAALSKNIPPEVVIGVAGQESSWRQFAAKDQPYISTDNGYGIMQVTDKGYDTVKLKTDIVYNIETGVNILNQKYGLSTLPKIKGAGRDSIENWYFPVMAYNGTMPVNSPLIRNDDHAIIRNWKTYQDKVFTHIEQDSYLVEDQNLHTYLAQYPFKYDDFEYDPNVAESIEFKQPLYDIPGGLHESNYLLKKWDIVKVTKDNANLRTQPTTSSSSTAQKINTVFVIDGDFKYTMPYDSKNRFVWFPVKSIDGKTSGYIASAYITKVKEATVIGVKNNTAYNKDVKIVFNKGPALLNGVVINNGQTVSKEGKYTLVVKDGATTISTINFTIDKTKPGKPSMNQVSDHSTSVYGKAETGSTVKLYFNNKYQKSVTAKNGSYSFPISKQKVGTSVSVTATDNAGNVSPQNSFKVADKTPPATPKIKSVTSTKVVGTAEKGATIRVYKGSTQIGSGKVSSNGQFTVYFKPTQKAKTKLVLNVYDQANNKTGVNITVR